MRVDPNRTSVVMTGKVDLLNIATLQGLDILEGVKAMIAAGATRVGASAGVKIVKEARGEATPTSKASGY